MALPFTGTNLYVVPVRLNGDADCFILGSLSSIGFVIGTNKAGISVFTVLSVGRWLLWEHVAYG